MQKDYYLKKRGNYWYYIITAEKPNVWRSLKNLIINESDTWIAISKSKKPVEAFMIRHLTDSKEQAELQEKIISRTTLNDYIKDWYVWDKCAWLKRQLSKGHSWKKATIKMKLGHLKNHILPALGYKRIDKITAVDIENALAETGLAAQTLQHIIYTLKPIFREMRRERLIKKNPIRSIDAYAIEHKRKNILEKEHIEKLWPPELEKMIAIWKEFRIAVFYYTSLTAGMRLGEVTALRWRFINLDTGDLLIIENIDSDNKVDTPKSGEARATILPKRALNLLRELRRQSPWTAPDDYVFTGTVRGKNADKTNLGKKLKPAIIAAGIENLDVSHHSLRHTYNTRMKRIIDVENLFFMIGHKDDKTNRIYDHAEIESQLKEKLIKISTERPKIDQAWE